MNFFYHIMKFHNRFFCNVFCSSFQGMVFVPGTCDNDVIVISENLSNSKNEKMRSENLSNVEKEKNVFEPVLPEIAKPCHTLLEPSSG